MPAKRRNTPSVLTEMQAAIIKIRAEYATQLSAKGLRSMPPGAREFVHEAQAAISQAESAIAATAQSVGSVLADRRIWPDARTESARAKLAALESLVAEKTTIASNALGMTKTLLVKQSLRPVDRREELTARADAQMILDRTDPKNRDAVMAQLATRQDAIGALVSSGWGRDYLGALTPDPVLADAMHSGIVNSAVAAAAAQNFDEDRRDAARALDTLPTLHGLRDAVMHTGRMVAESLRDDHGLAPGGSPVDAFPAPDPLAAPLAT